MAEIAARLAFTHGPLDVHLRIRTAGPLAPCLSCLFNIKHILGDLMRRFLLLAFAAAIMPATAHADGDAALGKTLFSRCSACHAVTAQNKIGPGLSGVVGRKAGSVSGFRYSKAMAAADLVWDEATLDQFLTAPSKLVPGTSMSFVMPKPEDRANIIAYLKTLDSAAH